MTVVRERGELEERLADRLDMEQRAAIAAAMRARRK